MINILRNNINKIRVKPHTLTKKRFISSYKHSNFMGKLQDIITPLSLCGGSICGFYGASKNMNSQYEFFENILRGCFGFVIGSLLGTSFTYIYILCFPITVPITIVSGIYSLSE